MKYIPLILFLFLSFFLSAQNISEAEYISLVNEDLQGQEEYRVTSGRIDILTETHAIEVERANKWKQSIGQSLWYGLETNKKPGIILILEKEEDYKYFIQLNTALDYAGLTDKIDVWEFPKDFPNIEYQETFSNETQEDTELLRRINPSGVRHNSTCQHYKSKRGKPCSIEEGRACRRCGG